MERQTHQAMTYVKVATELFMLASVFTAMAFTVMFIKPYETRPPTGDITRMHITLMDITSFLFFAITPLILAFLTYMTVTKPLKEGKTPSRPWNLVLVVLGYLFGLIVGGILLSMAYHKIHE
jgi:hypothetical protein